MGESRTPGRGPEAAGTVVAPMHHVVLVDGPASPPDAHLAARPGTRVHAVVAGVLRTDEALARCELRAADGTTWSYRALAPDPGLDGEQVAAGDVVGRVTDGSGPRILTLAAVDEGGLPVDVRSVLLRAVTPTVPDRASGQAPGTDPDDGDRALALSEGRVP